MKRNGNAEPRRCKNWEIEGISSQWRGVWAVGSGEGLCSLFRKFFHFFSGSGAFWYILSIFNVSIRHVKVKTEVMFPLYKKEREWRSRPTWTLHLFISFCWCLCSRWFPAMWVSSSSSWNYYNPLLPGRRKPFHVQLKDGIAGPVARMS